jgi:hypothetical protein
MNVSNDIIDEIFLKIIKNDTINYESFLKKVKDFIECYKDILTHVIIFQSFY